MTMAMREIFAALDGWLSPSHVLPGLGTEPTQTPGIFYHGSPLSNLKEIGSPGDLPPAIFFTQIASLAAIYSTVRGEGGELRRYGGGSGRIYAAELITKNPFHAPPGYFGEHPRDTDRERQLCAMIAEQGYDCIVTSLWNGLIDEVVVFDQSTIRLREKSHRLPSPEVASTNIFYCDEHSLDSYTAETITLFRSRARASTCGDGGSIKPALIDGRIPVYCDRNSWACLNLDVLRGLQVDCLIDPATGDAFAIDLSRIILLNRDMLRQYRRMRRKPVRTEQGIVLPPLRLGRGRAGA